MNGLTARDLHLIFLEFGKRTSHRYYCLLAVLFVSWATVLVAQSIETPGVFRYTVKVPDSVRADGPSPISVTVKIYVEESSDSPIWSEQFLSSSDANGRISLLIGSSVQGGLPRDLFAGNQARWIALQFGDAPEGFRAAMISVPYALKARDADTLGGLPASAFLRSSSVQSDPQNGDTWHTSGSLGSSYRLSIEGIQNTLAKFTTPTDLGASQITDTASGVGLGNPTPLEMLDVVGRGLFRSTARGPAGVWFGSNSSTSAFVGLASEENKALVFSHGGFHRMVITEDGRIGIGLDAPSAKLDVNGDIKLSSGALIFADGSSLTTAPSGALGTSNTFTAPQTDAAIHTFQEGITGTGTLGSLELGSGVLSASNTWSAVQSMNGGMLASSFNAMQVVGQGANTTLQAALNNLPSTGGTILIPAGTFACGITITKPVHLVGAAGGGLNDTSTFSTYVAGSVLQNTSTSGDCITVSLPASNSLGGVLLENLWIQGNKNVGGATAGDNIMIAGGNTANKNLRHVTIRNVLSTDAKGNNLTIKDNAYMLSVYDSQFYRAAGHGIGIAASGAGIPSQIAFYSVSSDLNAGDALNINGVSVHDIHAFRSTFADSLNGVNIVAGSTNANFTCTGCNFESNANAGVLIKDGYAHNIENSSFPSDGIQKYGVYLDPPPGANFVNQQLSLSNNSFGANTTKDVFISANAHFATIWPNSPNNYTYQDLSGVAQQILGKMAETDFTGTVRVASALSVGGGGVLYSTSQSGTGSICMTTNCAMTTPSLGAATATSVTATGTISATNVTATGAVSAESVTASGALSSARSLTATNCASAGAICGSASAGRVTIATSATTVTVTTEAVSANSEIFVQEDQSLDTALGVTCNMTMGRSYTVTARTAGMSFVITASAAPSTNPACLSYRIVN